MPEKREPPDLKRCQTMRPNTWPHMPSFMTFGPVSFKRCENQPSWLAFDGIGKMSLCGECKDVCAEVMNGNDPQNYKVVFEPIKAKRAKARS